jgi:hypothetical protein
MKGLLRSSFWELIGQVLVDRETKRLQYKEPVNPLVLSYANILINECLNASKEKQSTSLHDAACLVADSYKFSNLKNELLLLRKKMMITKFVEKNQWQLAVQVVTKSTESFLFNLLKKVRACTVYLYISYMRVSSTLFFSTFYIYGLI